MIKAIAFDLDDTLLDTTGILAPKATHDAFQFLINHGLSLTLNQCEELRIEMIKTVSHREVFLYLAMNHGNEKTKDVVDQAINLFYEPDIPNSLPLLAGAKENINILKKKYHLYLVTAGNETAQIKKAKALGVLSDFKKTIVVNSLTKQRKKSAFLEILKLEKILPDELLCIGNSLSSEITDALEINALACHFDFGEVRGHIESLQKKPHYTVKNHHELIPICRL